MEFSKLKLYSSMNPAKQPICIPDVIDVYLSFVFIYGAVKITSVQCRYSIRNNSAISVLSEKATISLYPKKSPRGPEWSIQHCTVRIDTGWLVSMCASLPRAWRHRGSIVSLIDLLRQWTRSWRQATLVNMISSGESLTGVLDNFSTIKIIICLYTWI